MNSPSEKVSMFSDATQNLNKSSLFKAAMWNLKPDGWTSHSLYIKILWSSCPLQVAFPPFVDSVTSCIGIFPERWCTLQWIVSNLIKKGLIFYSYQIHTSENYLSFSKILIFTESFAFYHWSNMVSCFLEVTGSLYSLWRKCLLNSYILITIIGSLVLSSEKCMSRVWNHNIFQDNHQDFPLLSTTDTKRCAEGSDLIKGVTVFTKGS